MGSPDRKGRAEKDTGSLAQDRRLRGSDQTSAGHQRAMRPTGYTNPMIPGVGTSK